MTQKPALSSLKTPQNVQSPYQSQLLVWYGVLGLGAVDASPEPAKEVDV